MEQLYMPVKIYDKKVSYEIRKEALRAIKTGKNLQAVEAANIMADKINIQSVYQHKYESLPPFELI